MFSAPLSLLIVSFSLLPDILSQSQIWLPLFFLDHFLLIESFLTLLSILLSILHSSVFLFFCFIFYIYLLPSCIPNFILIFNLYFVFALFQKILFRNLQWFQKFFRIPAIFLFLYFVHCLFHSFFFLFSFFFLSIFLFLLQFFFLIFSRLSKSSFILILLLNIYIFYILDALYLPLQSKTKLFYKLFILSFFQRGFHRFQREVSK